MVGDRGGVMIAFFVVSAALIALRWETVKRTVFSLEDPRTLAVLRIGFAVFTFWVFANMAGHWRFFYSDEGLYTLAEAKLRLGRAALKGWSPEYGFDGISGFLTFLWNRPSLFYFWGSPSFVQLHLWGFFFVLLLYGCGVFSRTTGVIAWFLMNSIYNRNSAYLEGTDNVYRVFWFLLIFANTGAAWSVDNWLRCRRLKAKGLLESDEQVSTSSPADEVTAEGAPEADSDEPRDSDIADAPEKPETTADASNAPKTTTADASDTADSNTDATDTADSIETNATDTDETTTADAKQDKARESSEVNGGNVVPALHPVYRLVPAWPRYLFMFQLAILYVRTGLVKYGPEWNNGNTLYYALNNIHFYRFDGLTQLMSAWFGGNLFKLNTWVTIWWERLFFMVLIGLAIHFAWKHQGEEWYQKQNRGWRRPLQRVLWVALWLLLWRINTVALTPDDDAFTFGATWVLHLYYAVVVPGSVALWHYLGTRPPIPVWSSGHKLGPIPLPGHKKLGPIPLPGFSLSQYSLRTLFLSRRVWLGLGIIFHGFIIVFMNIGLFPFIMIMTYASYFTGDELCGVLERAGKWTERHARFSKWLRPGWRRYLRPAFAKPKQQKAAEKRATGGPLVAYGLVMRTLVGAGAGYHCLAVSLLLFNPPPPLHRFRNELRDMFHTERWLSGTRTWQNWRMFPRPPRTNLFLRTVIVDMDGKEVVLANNVLAEKKAIELPYDRIRKMRRRLVKDDGEKYLKPWAHYYCREWALKHDGQRPHKVELYRLSSRIPNASWVRKHGYFDALKLKLYRKKLGTYKCTGNGRLPMYIKERYGLPITDKDRARAEDVERKLERVFPPPDDDEEEDEE